MFQIKVEFYVHKRINNTSLNAYLMKILRIILKIKRCLICRYLTFFQLSINDINDILSLTDQSLHEKCICNVQRIILYKTQT